MVAPRRTHDRIDLLQGTLDMLVLQTLQWGPRHGYGITQAIRVQSGEALQVDTGSLYPALRRLEGQRLVAASWKVSESNQRVREYRLTAKGRRQLLSVRTRWERLQAAIAGVLSAPKPTT